MAILFILFLAFTALLPNPTRAQSNDLPDDFEQIIPRGRIAAITNPQFVPAPEAEIAGDAWVLGVVIGGQARAFSLNILNHHEVVNDTMAGTSYAAVW
jgi:carotenoid cleavage dioxygenase-like enzyme